MEKLLTHIPEIQYHSPSLVAVIKSKLESKDIECSEQQAGSFKSALLIWDKTIPLEHIVENTEALCRDGYKIILLNLQENISDTVKWQLVAAGASDIIDWADEETALNIITARLKRWKAIEDLLLSPNIINKMIGESSAWKGFLRKVIETAYFTRSNILIMGESGTGKELTAGLVHELDQRKDKRELVLLDCTTITPELFGSEFYGHEKGAFTTGIYSREGAFALANNGSLFLDELGELPLTLQAGLLRVIQEKTYKRVGSNTWNRTNFRLICATNKNIREEMAKGHFREDLYYRVASSIFTIPPLRERREDIPELIRYFLRQELNVIAAPGIDSAVMNYLIYREYPGNIRELKQLAGRIAMRYTGEDLITIGDLPEEERNQAENQKPAWNNGNISVQQSIRLAIAGGKDLAKIKNDIANLAFEIAMEDCNGNLKLAAKKLDVEVRTLQYIRKKNNNEPAK